MIANHRGKHFEFKCLYVLSPTKMIFSFYLESSQINGIMTLVFQTKLQFVNHNLTKTPHIAYIIS